MSEQKVQTKVFALKALQVEIETIAKSEKDVETQSALMRLAKKVRYSDPMSNQSVADIEDQIRSKVLALKSTSEKKPLINEIDVLLDERNAKCKISK